MSNTPSATLVSPPRKPVLWLLVADLERPDLPLVVPSVAWLARDAGALFECYFESARDGRLFARTGSTVLGGSHHQQFNYLQAAFDVRAILLGDTAVFDSSLAAFGTPVLVQTNSTAELYAALLKGLGRTSVATVIVTPDAPAACGGQTLDLGPYLFPEIYFRQALAVGVNELAAVRGLLAPGGETLALFASVPDARQIDTLQSDDTYGTLTLRIAERWKPQAKGVVFGDPPAVLSQLAAHCRHDRVAVYAPRTPLAPSAVEVSAYTEATSAVAAATARLAEELGNRVLVGRQTGDGDLFEWSKRGVCIQIIDPNRPAFPVVETVAHPWQRTTAGPFDLEPTDDQLRQWLREGRVLATLIWHSGEVAHNEAMLNLCDVAGVTGVKMGIGVHAARYETCPQLWELLNVPREKGGVRGLIEPVLHSGGMGVLAECNCPPALLQAHCTAALARIRERAGANATPRGYYAFMDSDLATLTRLRPDIWAAVAATGLEYVVSSAMPGRNRALWQAGQCIALNQSCRVIHGASPFVRITTVEDLETASSCRPGWLVAALDAPVIAFDPYIWRHGSRFLQIVDALLNPNRYVNVTPHVVARYARILMAEGILPPPACEGRS